MNKIILTTLCTLILTACGSTPVPPYRWHRTGASENEIARQQRICNAQAQHDTKQGKEAKSLEQCMDEAGYYRYEKGNL